MKDDFVFSGNIKRIQWNNQLLSGFLFIYFIIAILFFSLILLLPILGIILTLDPDYFQVNAQNSEGIVAFHITRVLRIPLKVFMFSLLGALYFMYRSTKDIAYIFDASPLQLNHNDTLYRMLENQGIMRGLRVPNLFVTHTNNLTTAAVVCDLTGKYSVIFSQKSLSLPQDEQEALIAQIVMRIYSRDVIFLTYLCFFGFFPFHIKQNVGNVRYTILKPFLWLTDRIMYPIRNWIINLRFAKLDAASLELTKEKQKTAKLLQSISSAEDILKYYYEAYLPLFIAQSDELYRLKSLHNA